MSRGFLKAGLCVALAAGAGVASRAGVADSAVPVAAKPAATTSSFQSAWAQFRAAVLARDFKRVAELTAFPLSVHGVTDDEVEPVGRQGFAAVFDKMLRARPDGPGSASNLDRIRATPGVTDPGGSHVVTVGGVEFKRTAAGPRLVRIYVDDE